MNKSQYEALSKADLKIIRLTGKDLIDKTPRTLIWGFTCSRNSFHIYLDSDGIIHKVVYSYPDNIIYHFSTEDIGIKPEDCSPDKRIYPEASDMEFCECLKNLDIHLSFTTFNEARDLTQKFHGLKIEELKKELLN